MPVHTRSGRSTARTETAISVRTQATRGRQLRVGTDSQTRDRQPRGVTEVLAPLEPPTEQLSQMSVRTPKRLRNQSTSVSRRPAAQVMQSIDFNDTDEETDSQTPRFGRRTGRLCDPFTGQDSLMKVADWLALFEMVTRGMSSEEKTITVCRHVTGKAMGWLAGTSRP